MRIERTSVPEFGPLRGVELELDPGLNVIFGPNEAGKTTLLDVILARLFRWEKRRGTRLSTVMGDLDRFGDPGEAAGRLELRLGGELLEYPGGPSLLHRLGLEHAGLAGLFCVRSGELELPQTEPGEFWAELKKVLSGLPRGVDTLRERAHAEAGLTPTGQLSDAGDPGRKTRLAELERRRDRLEDLEERLPDASDYEDRIAGLEERKRNLQRARRERVVELREQWEARTGEREDHPTVPEESLDRWRELAGDRERAREEIASLEEELRQRREALREQREARAEAETEAEAAAERVEAARGAELAERAREWSRSVPEAGTSPDTAGRMIGIGTAALLLAGLALAAELAAGVVPGGTLPVAGVSALLAAAGGAAAWRGRRQRERRRALEEERARIRADAAAAGLEADVDELPAAVRNLEDRRNERERKRDLARERCRSARERAEECEEELEARRGRLEEIDDEIGELREELGFETLEEAERAHRRRRELEEEIDRLESSLAELAGRDPESWRGVDRPEAEEEGEEPPEWDPAAWTEVEEELEEVRRGYRELQHEFVRAGLSTPEDVLSELRSCRAEIREIEVDREAGLLAGEIFGEMDEALEQRLSEALSREGEGSVAELLHRVTGRYRSVSRSGGSGLTVRDGEGRAFAMEGLSRGTRDQVYLALRVGLAAAALEAAELEEPGFLLLDDAFLTADWERRERLVEAVASLTERGWQVVYLTCDTHLRELFEEAGGRALEL